MKLKTLFVASLSSLLLAILIIILLFNIKTMQSYIQNQVYSSSQDTAYALGLALSNIDGDDALIEMEIMMNAIFDSGYYAYIRLVDDEGKVFIETKLPLVVKDVPSWFISMIPLDIPEASSEIHQGWDISKTLLVKGHSGYAYYELWKNFKYFVFIYSIIALSAFIILITIVTVILRALHNIKEQAEAIDKHQFIQQKNVSFVTEFRILTNTMNQMVRKVEAIFTSEMMAFQKYQSLNYKDEETLLPNKKYLILKMREMLELRDEEIVDASMAIISINGLSAFKKENSYASYLKALLHITQSISKELGDGGLLTRISEDELAILFYSNTNTPLSLSLDSLKLKGKLLCVNSGFTSIGGFDEPSQILSRADYALQKANLDGCNNREKTINTEVVQQMSALGKNAWRQNFEDIFKQKRITYALQSARNVTDESIFHNETYLRIIEKDKSIQPAMFYIPMAYSLGVMQKFDQSIIEIVLNALDSALVPTAINLSKDCIIQSHYFQELRKRLSTLDKKHHHKIHFECKEQEILKDIESYINFSQMIEESGQCFGIDRFNGLENIEYIKKIRPHYIKVSTHIIYELQKNNPVTLNAFNVLAQVMDFTIIVTAVQSKEQLQELQDLGYETFQGNFIEEPRVELR